MIDTHASIVFSSVRDHVMPASDSCTTLCVYIIDWSELVSLSLACSLDVFVSCFDSAMNSIIHIYIIHYKVLHTPSRYCVSNGSWMRRMEEEYYLNTELRKYIQPILLRLNIVVLHLYLQPKHNGCQLLQRSPNYV